MPVNKKQIMRMVKFVAELRRNAYPNATTFAKKLRDAELMENLNIACSERTVMRDLEVLKRDFHAPIRFSSENNGYFLENQYWEFQVPLQTNEAIMGAMLGARLAEDIMPSPVKEQIRKAVDETITNNNSEFFDHTYLESLLVAAGTKTSIKPAVFETVFQGWRECRMLHLTYKKGSTGEVSERDFEPHIVAYHKGNWYSKGVDCADDKVIVLAIFRIQSAKLSKYQFSIRRDILEDTRKNGLFNYPKIENIQVRCAPEIAYYLYEQKQAKKLIIEPQENGSLLVTLPPSSEEEALRWIMGEGGRVEVIQPVSLRKKVHQLALTLAEVNQT